MSAPPYMKLYIADYLGDTHHLGALEHGAYLMLLMSMWRAGGSLPAADANLAKLARCTPDQWAAVRDDVLPFFRRARGRLTHKRLAAEMSKYENTSGKRSEAGKRGRRQNINKNNAPEEAFAQQTDGICRHNQNQNQNQKEDGGVVVGAQARIETEPDDWPTADPARELIAEVASPWLDPAKSLALVTTAGRLTAWKAAGASWRHDVIPVVQALTAKRREPVSSWKFFDAAIARSIAENRAALEIPEAQPRATGPPQSIADRIAADHAEARRRVLAS